MATPLQILNAEPARFNREAAALLSTFGCYREAECDRAALLRRVESADVLIVRLAHSIDAEVLARASRLKIIASATTGLNHIDLAEAERRNISVVCLKGETEFLSRITATAEHTWGLLLALMRKLPAAAGHVLQGGWDRDLFIGHELRGKTLGVIGYGRLGRIVAEYGRAFRMKVIICDRKDCAVEAGIEQADLQTVLTQSDVVSLHVNFEPENARMIGRDVFAAMKQGAVFVNTARGELVDEDALIDALETGRLRGAGLDVLAAEKGAAGGWLAQRAVHAYAKSHDNLIITPHIGGACVDSMHETELFLARKITTALSEMGFAHDGS